MAIQFRPLPLDIFDHKQRPAIARLNSMLHDLCALEGTIKQPLAVKRSDNSISRIGSEQVHVTRITPDIMDVVSGVSAVVAVPSLTLGQTNTIGTTSGVVSVNSSIALFGTQVPAALAATAATGSSAFAARADHVHLFPTSLRSTTNGFTLLLADNGISQSLTGTSGSISIRPANEIFDMPRWSGVMGSGVVRDVWRADARDATTHGAELEAGVVAFLTRDLSGAVYGSTQVEFLGFQTQLRNDFGPTYTGCKRIGVQALLPTSTAFSSGTHTWAEHTGVDITLGYPRQSGSGTVTVTDFFGIKLDWSTTSLINVGTVTNARGARIDMPPVGGTIRRGIHIITESGNGGTEPTNAEGVYVDGLQRGTSRSMIYSAGALTGTPTNSYNYFAAAHVVGTNRYAFYGVSDTLYHGGTLRHAGALAGLYGATPTVQFGTTGTQSGFAAGSSTAVTVDSTFTGNTGTLAYTFGDAIRALKLLGALAY